MEARILLAADFANVDSAGKLNIIGAFNRIILREFPSNHSLMYLVIRLAAVLGEFNEERILKVILFDVDAREKWKTPDIPFTIPAPEGGRTAEFHPIIAIRDMEFDSPGRYEFRVYINGDDKGSIPLDVEKFDQPKGA